MSHPTSGADESVLAFFRTFPLQERLRQYAFVGGGALGAWLAGILDGHIAVISLDTPIDLLIARLVDDALADVDFTAIAHAIIADTPPDGTQENP